MARKVFISYKYSDVVENSKGHINFRDKLIELLGDDGHIYKGEDGLSDDLSGFKADTIKNKLKTMIHDTTVTIVLISPNVKESKWVDWEISYSLKDIERNKEGRSRMNGIIGVILPTEFSEYSYIMSKNTCNEINYDTRLLPDLVVKNMFNVKEPSKYVDNSRCGGMVYDGNYGSYISLYKWDDFIKNKEEYIDIAYKKSKSLQNNYEIKKEQN